MNMNWIFFILPLSYFGSAVATKVSPVITCHSDFKVTITAGSWELIAVEGYELLNATDPQCVSQSKFGELNFDVQSDCQAAMSEYNNTYAFTLRARQEWMVETSEDRLIQMKCEYYLTGDGTFNSSSMIADQDFTVAPTVSATQATVIAGAKLLLVNARDDQDGGGTPNGKWGELDEAQVGQRVRLVVDTTSSPSHPDYPFIGVTGCWFYDTGLAGGMRFDMINGDGCANPPSYYDPFKAAATPFVYGMLLNKQPVDDADTNDATDPVSGANGYLTGSDEPGVAYSDVFKVFKFPGSNFIRAKCTIRFCVEKNDPNCITPNCNGRLYGGLYSLGGYDTVFKRKRRSAAIAKKAEEVEEEEGKDLARRRRGEEEEEEEEKTSGNVEFIIRIVDGGGSKSVNISSSGLDQSFSGEQGGKTAEVTSSCKMEFYILLAICCLLGIAILCSVVTWTSKKSHQNQEAKTFRAKQMY